MKRTCWLYLIGGVAAGLLLSTACRRQPETVEVDRIRVGVIASLSGPGRSWGETTVRCAQVIADYHNERGGFLIDGKRYPVELIVEDDALNPERAAEIAEEFILEKGIHYVIGPLGDDSVVAAAPILDAYDVAYVHYGFDPDLLGENSSGILGMPLPAQSLPVMLEFLKDEFGHDSVAVLARNREEAIYQKRIAEGIAEENGFTVRRFSKFDVSEETYDVGESPARARDWAERVSQAAPDAVILTGISPAELPTVATYLRGSGFTGVIVAQNSQDLEYLRRAQTSKGDGLYFVGGFFPESARTPYYEALTADYLSIAEDISEEYDTKLYALEFLLRLIRAGGAEALERPELLRPLMDSVQFQDPFISEERSVRLVGHTRFGARRQITVPIVISYFKDGKAEVVYYGKIED